MFSFFKYNEYDVHYFRIAEYESVIKILIFVKSTITFNET